MPETPGGGVVTGSHGGGTATHGAVNSKQAVMQEAPYTGSHAGGTASHGAVNSKQAVMQEAPYTGSHAGGTATNGAARPGPPARAPA